VSEKPINGFKIENSLAKNLIIFNIFNLNWLKCKLNLLLPELWSEQLHKKLMLILKTKLFIQLWQNIMLLKKHFGLLMKLFKCMEDMAILLKVVLKDI
jgi:hypothetical protein